ncbi:Sodium/alanine symporter AgcS [Chlamydiales bacterium STE3]|nr:Sodium/alanine symporter AgcS [Chlamydiales bacterium STE3]
MEHLDELLKGFRDFVWGPPLLLLLLGTGLYLTFLLRGVQFRYFLYAFKQIYAEQNKNSEGDINPYESLMTSLAGAIGTGSIVGVSTAIYVGGVGALFWMWVTAVLGMATKYAESLLAIKYRNIDARGEMIGGPMEYIEKGLKMKWMAALFAFLGCLAAFGTGNLVQVNSIADALNSVWQIDPWISGLILAIITGVVIIGGIRSIGQVAGIIVPFMALMYVGGGMIILCVKWQKVPIAFVSILTSALDIQSLSGGFLGSSLMMAIQAGVSRSVFSNEAGLGISSIAAAAARTDSPGRQAMITMTGALFSTLIVCTITGLVLIVTDTVGAQSQGGVALAINAFSSILPGGEYIVTIGLILFAFTTVLAWAYYGEKCFEYLLGEKSVFFFRLIFCVLVIPGAALKLEVAWYFADIANGLMAIPNLIALVGLSKVIVNETSDFLKIIAQERLIIS